MSTVPVNIPEIERLTKELSERLQAVTGCKPRIDVWFHHQDSDTRPLAHDAVACGYKAERIWIDREPHHLSHISVHKYASRIGIWIHVLPRKA